MNMKLTLLAASMLAAPALAMAQPVSGVYIGAGAGGGFVQTQKFRGDSGGTGRIKVDPGFAGVGSVGYGFGNGFRAELQGDFRQNSLKHSAHGDRQQFGGFVNGLYDFDLGPVAHGVVPYVGLGVGYEQALVHANGRTPTDGNFAAQAIAGAAYDITSVPGLALTGEYRFTSIPENLHLTVPGSSVHTAGTYDHAVLVGFRYAFGQSAPAPVAETLVSVPPPMPASQTRTYMVFFDWNRSDLSGRAREIIGTAAQAGSVQHASRIEVDGHTDTSGSRGYNQGALRAPRAGRGLRAGA